MVEKINKIILIFLLPLFFSIGCPSRCQGTERHCGNSHEKTIRGCPNTTRSAKRSPIRSLPLSAFCRTYSLYEAADNPALLELDTSNLENLKTFSKKHSYDEVLFGKLVRNEQEKLQFLLQIYDLGEHDIIVEQEAVAETLLDVFDTADVMTLDLLGQITDVNIGFGTIELIKAEGSGNYEVYLDGKTIRNPEKEF